MIQLHNEDCLPAMREMEDNAFDLAIVDPPYAWGNKGIDIRRQHKVINWNNAKPTKEYFTELFRVSKNQIIWGGNYFELPPTRGFIFWNKHQPLDNYADGEYAWTSFDRNCKLLDYGYTNVINYQKRIHPTEKPYQLYKWLLHNYAKEGQTILDTHLGSGSIAIACHDYGYDLTGFEIDKDYFEAATKRLKQHQSQLSLHL